MFRFPSEQREREREREREKERDRETYELTSVSLSFFLPILLYRTWTKRYLITPQTNGQSNIRIHQRIFLYCFFLRSLLHLTSSYFHSFSKKIKIKNNITSLNLCYKTNITIKNNITSNMKVRRFSLPPDFSLSLLLSFSSLSHFLSFSKKKKNFKYERVRFFISWSVHRYRSVDRYRGRARYIGPLCGNLTVKKRCEKIALWTAIGRWTAIGDGSLTGYFIYLRRTAVVLL